MILIALILITSCTYANMFKNGDECYVNKKCLSATEGYYDELNKVSNRNDKYALAEMISSGHVYILETHFKLTIIEQKIWKI